MNRSLPQTQDPPAAAITTTVEGSALVKHLSDVMDALLGTIEEETALVRAGNLKEALKLEKTKTELSRMYIADTARFKANQTYLNRAVPEITKELRQRHQQFRAILQMNLTVLATAHAVSESIMRGVSSELARKATPGAYGASGRSTMPSAAARQPLTFSRVL